MKKLLINALRWLLVLPLSIIALLFAYSICSIVFGFCYYLDFTGYIAEFISSQVSSLAYIVTGMIIAPIFKKQVAIFLGILYLIYSVYSLIDPYNLYQDISLIESAIYKIGGILGCFAGYYIYKERFSN